MRWALRAGGSARGAGAGGGDVPTSKRAKPGSAEERAARKAVPRVEKAIKRLAAREAELNVQVLEPASDHAKVATLGAELSALAAEKDELELEWLEASELLE